MHIEGRIVLDEVGGLKEVIVAARENEFGGQITVYITKRTAKTSKEGDIVMPI